MADNALNAELREFNSSTNLFQLRKEGGSLTTQELRDLKARIKAREEVAELEDRMRAFEDRKSSSTAERSHESGKRRQRVSTPADPSSSESSSSESDSDSSDNSSSDSERPCRKKRRTAKGIKVTPGYILRIGSSFREWGDWKREIERVFEGDPRTYRKGQQKIIKALDYVDKSLKTLWYTYRDQNRKDETTRWKIFLKWTRDNIQNGQNATAMLYERYETARQKSDKSPAQFNAYLSSIERDLPRKDENSSVLAFYSKLTDELKKQFKTADIKMPETRSECVAVAQRVWEGLHHEDNKMKESRHTNRRLYSKDIGHKDKEDYNRRHGHKGLYRRDSQKDWTGAIDPITTGMKIERDEGLAIFVSNAANLATLHLTARRKRILRKFGVPRFSQYAQEIVPNLLRDISENIVAAVLVSWITTTMQMTPPAIRQTNRIL